MSFERTRERLVELLREMKKNTVANGCTPGEAAHFAAKVAELMEKHQIADVELAQEKGEAPAPVDMCEVYFSTGKKVFNPGTRAVLSGLSVGMCCKLVMTYSRDEVHGALAVYGIVGDRMDAEYVSQIAGVVLPALQAMAMLEGREHGEEKAGLVRWQNQYLIGAGDEIRKRLESQRKERSESKKADVQAKALIAGKSSTALMVVTGETLAVQKREESAKHLKALYPTLRSVRSRSHYSQEARQRGREAGKRVGLNVPLPR